MFVDLVDVLECWVSNQEGLCSNAELEQNRSQCTAQSIRIQPLSSYYFSRTIEWIRPKGITAIMISNANTIDMIFMDQAYINILDSIQRLIKRAFDRIH